MSHQSQSQFGMESQYDQQPRTQGSGTITGGGFQGGGSGSQGYVEGGQSIQGGPEMGGQSIQGGPEMGGFGGGMDLKLDEALSDQMRVALHDFVASANACEWCAERCIDEGPEMAECLRLCRDVADLASLNIKLLARDSVFGPEAAEVFVAAADACARECAQHHHRHCQECAEVLGRAIQSVQQMLASFGGGAGGQPPQIQPQTGQMQGMGQGAPTGQQF